MTENRYYWLKLHENFFDEKNTKYLRSLPAGETLVIIYLKMQLKSLKTEGFIKYDGLLPTCEDELALILDEDTNNVKLCIGALEKLGAVERWENDTLYMASLQPLIGSESAVAKRVRRHRENKKQLALQCNNAVTMCNTEIEIDKEIDKEIEIEKEKRENIDYSKIINSYNDTCVSFPQLRTLSESRKKAIKARLHSGYTYDDFETLFKKSEASSFLKGSNSRNWSASFDWMIKDQNMAKVLEGNYDDKQVTTPQPQKSSNRALDRLRELGEIK